MNAAVSVGGRFFYARVKLSEKLALNKQAGPTELIFYSHEDYTDLARKLRAGITELTGALRDIEARIGHEDEDWAEANG